MLITHKLSFVVYVNYFFFIVLLLRIVTFCILLLFNISICDLFCYQTIYYSQNFINSEEFEE